MNLIKSLLIAAAATALVACGGGGGSEPIDDSSASSPPPPPAPPPDPPPAPPPPDPTPPPPGSGSLIGSGTASFTLSWTPPTTNTDGSALTDLAGYKILIGISSGDYTETVDLETVGLSRYVVQDVPIDTYFVVMTSVNSSGVESTYSGEVAAMAN
ncbi:MAG: hypothetical protein AAFX44_19690 [Pseudomonadota bacterium]